MSLAILLSNFESIPLSFCILTPIPSLVGAALVLLMPVTIGKNRRIARNLCFTAFPCQRLLVPSSAME